MDKIEFNKIAAKGTREVKLRERLLEAVLDNNSYIKILFKNIREVDNSDSKHSARILELACKRGNLNSLLPYINDFYELVPRIKIEAVLRSFAKIIELLTIEYFIDKNPALKKVISDTILEQFTESCFDWMITDKSIAIQAHSMYALYLLGTKYDWIHLELVQLINKNLPNGSTGYQNRGKRIINAIKTDRLLKLQKQTT